MSRKVKNMFRRSVGLPIDEAIEPEEIEEAHLCYTASNGAKHLIREMPDGYIHNAVAKLRRSSHPTILTRTTIASMDKEIERRAQLTGEGES
jgi:hypothetical protein